MMREDASLETPPREDATRDHLLETGMRLFAIYGFDSVTTRVTSRAT